MYHVYAISSLAHHYIYVGLTQDIDERLHRHNTGREKTTRFYAPFILIYQEVHPDRVSARNREKYWKSGIGKKNSD